MIFAVLLLSAQAAPLPKPLLPANHPSCRYDRAAMLALNEKAFDQDFAGGWRSLSNLGCDTAAADLISEYRAEHPSDHAFLSFWHEGQLRADAGQTKQAITLFDRARKTEAEDHGFGWNLYVDGSIAFLRGNRLGLQAARDRLAALPRPPGLSSMVGPDGKPRPVRWPFNLNVLEGFLRCFDKPYRVAYAAPCSAPMMRISTP